MKHFKAHIQDGVPFRQNHFIPECGLPFFSSHRFNRTMVAIGYTGDAVQCGRRKAGGLTGNGKVVLHRTEPLEPDYRLSNVGQLTKVQKISNSRTSKYKIVSNP
jgi:hypothetical protein